MIPRSRPSAIRWRWSVFLQQAFVTRIADEGNLRKNRGHVRADQHHKRRFFHSAIPLVAADELKPLRERILNVAGELFGFLDFVVARNLLDDVLQIVHGFLRERVFARRYFHGVRRGREIQVVGFDSAGVGIVAGVRVNRNEKIRLGFIRDSGAVFEGNEVSSLRV